MGEQVSNVAKIPAGELYWGIIDTSGLPPVPFGPLRRGAVEARLAHQFDPMLPVPVEDVHAVYLPIGGHRFVACGIDRDLIARLQRQGDDAVVPNSIPALVLDTAGSDVNTGTLNLLTRAYQPVATIQRKARRRTIIAAALAVACVLITLGNLRRESAARAAAEDLRHQQLSVYQDALGESALAGPTPPAVRLTTELRRLSATRGEQSIIARPRATLDLQGVLALWPAGTKIRVEHLAVQPGRIDITAEAADAGTVNQLIESLGGLQGWELESNRTDRNDADGTVRVRLGYERTEEGRTS